MKYLKVGKVVNTHGLKGELKIKPMTSFDRFEVGNLLKIEFNDEIIELKIETSRVHKQMHLVKFFGFDNINDVLKFKTCDIKIPINELEELDNDEFYYYELVGKKVYNQYDKYVGIVNEVLEVPQGELLEILSDKKVKSLVPYNESFIEEIDKENNIIKINEIEGLINED